MAKFYVQCGPIQAVLVAESADQAALSLIDRALQSHLWIYDDAELMDRNRHDHLMLEALMHLEPAIRVSERGFDRGDAQWMGTPETIDRWHRLMTGIRRLITAAGLPPRSLALVAVAQDEASSAPRIPR